MATNTEVGVKITVDGSDAVQSVGSIKKQLREATADLIAMRQKFGDTSKEAVEAAKRVANLKDEIGDAKAFTDAFNPDAKFKAFGAALQGVAGGFAAVQGAQALFGSESKELEKTLVKVQGAMALSQGLNSVLEARDSFKNLATFVKGGLSNAFGSLRQAIISTGIGALVVAVGLLIANFDKVKKVVLNFVPGLAAVGDTIMGIVNAVTDFLGVTSEAQRQTDKLISDTEKRIKQTESFLDANADKYDEYTQRKIKANLEYNKKLVEVNKNEEMSEAEKQALLKQYRDKADREIKKAGDDRQKAADEVAKKEREKADEARKKREAIEAEARKKREEKEKEHQQKLAEQQKISEDFIIQQRLQGFKNEFDRRQFELSVQNQQEIDKQLEFLNQKLITEQEYNNRRAIIDADFAAKQAANEAERIKTKEEKEAEEKAKRDAAAAEEKANLQKIFEDRIKDDQLSFELRQESLQTALDLGLITQIEYNEKYKQLSEARIKVDEAEAQAKVENVAKIGGMLSQLGDIIGRETAAGKAAAVAAATIDTYQAAWSAFKAAQKNPIAILGPAYPYISAGLAVAGGLANIRKIIAVKTPGPSGGASVSAPSGGAPSVPTAPLTPQAETTLINQSQVNQIGNVAARAYVVESDVSGNQQRIQRLERAARIA
jgi:hypothetical protein